MNTLLAKGDKFNLFESNLEYIARQIYVFLMLNISAFLNNDYSVY